MGLIHPRRNTSDANALMARRLVERGVRYVQIYSGGGNFTESWDAHFDLVENHGMHAKEDRSAYCRAVEGSERPRSCSIPRS